MLSIMATTIHCLLNVSLCVELWMCVSVSAQKCNIIYFPVAEGEGRCCYIHAIFTHNSHTRHSLPQGQPKAL